ncbi:hypothetical protein [Niabella hibiscisoli]|uniref:hypothetical protein n=1 Tax=Niabella hibiscisoli TaxID=1825928 RepID=UPI001F0EDF34|nr:hypothetical protein [Niabella hibiscisoli]MCH5720213.1 hypothetical protein [Niabella hibiscisoli]
MKKSAKSVTKKNTSKAKEFSPLSTDEFRKDFYSIGFTHHYEILIKTKTVDERIFYITKTANEFLSVDTLLRLIRSELYKKNGKVLNNFSKTITSKTRQEQALQIFKDEYLLDFINIEDPDLVDERELEDAIVRNIKKSYCQ